MMNFFSMEDDVSWEAGGACLPIVSMQTARELRQLTAIERGSKQQKGALVDYKTVYIAFLTCDWSAARRTELCEKYGSWYCALLQVLAANYRREQVLYQRSIGDPFGIADAFHDVL